MNTAEGVFDRILSTKHSDVMSQDEKSLILFNPALYTQNYIRNFTISGKHIELIDFPKEQANLMPVYTGSNGVLDPSNTDSMLFLQVNLKPLEIQAIRYKVHPAQCDECVEIVKETVIDLPNQKNDLSVENSMVKLVVKKETLGIEKALFKSEIQTKEIVLDEEMYYYNGQSTHSCIYTFKPTQQRADKLFDGRGQTMMMRFNGSLVQGLMVASTNSRVDYSK